MNDIVAIVFRCLDKNKDVYRAVVVAKKDFVDRAIAQAYETNKEICDYEFAKNLDLFL